MYVKALSVEYINDMHAPARRYVSVHTYKPDTHMQTPICTHIGHTHANTYMYTYICIYRIFKILYDFIKPTLQQQALTSSCMGSKG